jgi:hypothetical protein
MGTRTRNRDKSGPTDGAQVTPAPTTPVKPMVQKDFGSNRGQYGGNQASHASSVNPGKSVTSPLADELRSRQVGLDDVVANGARHRDDPSTFAGRKPTPDIARGMKDPNAGNSTVPGPGRQPKV